MVPDYEIMAACREWVELLRLPAIAADHARKMEGCHRLTPDDYLFGIWGFTGVRWSGYVTLPDLLATEGHLLGVKNPSLVAVRATSDRPVPLGCDARIPAGAEQWSEKATAYAETAIRALNDSVRSDLALTELHPDG